MIESLYKEDNMSKEKSKQKASAKKKPQHTLKEKREAKRHKGEGNPVQMMPK